MLNLLRFAGDAGREQYFSKYGPATTPLISKRGGGPVISDEKIDRLILVRYPSTETFLEMIASHECQATAIFEPTQLNSGYCSPSHTINPRSKTISGIRHETGPAPWGYDETFGRPPRGGLAALEELRRRNRTRHYFYRTERTYADWVRRFLTYLAERQKAPNPRLDSDAVQDYLARLAVYERRECPFTN